MVTKVDTGTLIAKNTYAPDVMKKKNVVGVGIGYKIVMGKKTKEEAIVVFVEKKQPLAALEEHDEIAPRIHVSGVPTPVDVVEIGRIEALQVRTDKWRPAPGGVSIGHYKITAGTFGVVVRDKYSRAKVILSNNHVLANSNDAEVGDDIYQPGPIDGGEAADKIANLYRFERIDFGEEEPTCDLSSAYVRFSNWLAKLVNSSHRVSVKKIDAQAVNLVDAAIAVPIEESIVSNDILEIGEIEGVAEGYLGMKVAKSGRTTEYTEGTIEYVEATVQVNYGGGRIATFEKQLISGYMSQGGDSGSLLVQIGTRALKPRAVGLLFAGSNTSTIYNPIQAVIDALSIEI